MLDHWQKEDILFWKDVLAGPPPAQERMPWIDPNAEQQTVHIYHEEEG